MLWRWVLSQCCVCGNICGLQKWEHSTKKIKGKLTFRASTGIQYKGKKRRKKFIAKHAIEIDVENSEFGGFLNLLLILFTNCLMLMWNTEMLSTKQKLQLSANCFNCHE